jgi:hypothetical protein
VEKMLLENRNKFLQRELVRALEVLEAYRQQLIRSGLTPVALEDIPRTGDQSQPPQSQSQSQYSSAR